MTDRTVKWFMYTVLVGLIPVLCRLLVWTVSQERNVELLNAGDLVVFGLILHISCINEIEHFNQSQKSWKTVHNGTSIAFITGYGVLLAAYLLGQSNPGLISTDATKIVALVLSATSFFLTFSAYNRISKLSEES